MNLERCERSTLAQCQCGILPLHVKTGHCVGELVHERKCLLCNNKKGQNEFHFRTEYD